MGGRRVVLLLACTGLLVFGSTSFAHADPTDAPKSDPSAPLPRSGPLFLSLALGANASYVRYVSDPLWAYRLTLSLDVGLVLGERAALFVDGYIAMLLPIPIGGVVTAAGVGSDWAFGAGGPVHLRVVVRPAPVSLENNHHAWLFEMGVGYGRRRDRIDRSWFLSATGGPFFTDIGTGWEAGLGIAHSWSRW